MVGVHGDTVANRILGQNLPLLNLHERVLSVLGCRFVDNALLDAPYQVTSAMVNTLKITTVVAWSNEVEADEERYAYAREAGILQVMENPDTFDLDGIFQRIYENEAAYQAKFKRKMQAENEFLNSKYGRSNGKK
jgi:ethanolamine-phosphate cytidylyltransferase